MPNRPSPSPSDLDAMSELFEAVLAEQAADPKAPAAKPAPAPTPQAEAPTYTDMFGEPAPKRATATVSDAEPREMPALATAVNYAIYVLGGALIIGFGVWLLAPEATSRLLSDPSLLLDRLDELWRSVLEVILP